MGRTNRLYSFFVDNHKEILNDCNIRSLVSGSRKLKAHDKLTAESYCKTIKNAVANYESGLNITHSVAEACAFTGYKYSDTLRRSFSNLVEAINLKDNSEPSKKELEDKFFSELKQRVPDLTKSTYLVTWAQAETSVHQKAWNAMKQYAKFRDAEIIVQASRYKSPTSLGASKEVEDGEKNGNLWDEAIREHLCVNRVNLCPNLSVLADVKVQPTAALPLSGLNGFTASESCILPHPKTHLDSMPVLDDYGAKIMTSTGAITVANYTDTKAGKKGEFHHTIGFVIAEVEKDGVFHLRHVMCDEDDGSFYDLWYRVDEFGVSDVRDFENAKYPFAKFGDIHYLSHDEQALATAENIAQILRFENICLEDLCDGKSVNHHEEHNPFVLLEKERLGHNDLYKEMTAAAYYAKELQTLTNAKIHVIASNHNDFIDRWLCNTDWRKSNNKVAYLELSNAVANNLCPKGVFAWFIDKQNFDNVITYGYGDSLRIKDIELGLHGDKGANGARGSIKQFKGLSTKSMTAHGHAPKREDGAVQVGTLTKKRLGYNKGLSSWMHGIGICYPSGKTTHIHIIQGNRFTNLKY